MALPTRTATGLGVAVGVVIGWITGGAPTLAGFSDASLSAAPSVSTVNFRPAAPTFGTPTCAAIVNTITTVQIRWLTGDTRITTYTVSRTAPVPATVATVPDPDLPGQTLTTVDSPGTNSATYRITANNPYGWDGASPTATVTCP